MLSDTQAHTAILIIGHGSRNASSNAAFLDFVATTRLQLPGFMVAHAFLELAEPAMQVVAYQLAARYKRLVLSPLLLLRAGHAKQDIPELQRDLQNKFPDTEILISDALGIQEQTLLACQAHICNLIAQQPIQKGALHILMVGRGSKDTEATASFAELCQQVQARLESQQSLQVHATYLHGQKPHPEEVLAALLADGVQRIVVQPYLIFPGRLAWQVQDLCQQFQKQYPGAHIMAGNQLWPHEALVAALVFRIEQILAAQV